MVAVLLSVLEPVVPVEELVVPEPVELPVVPDPEAPELSVEPLPMLPVPEVPLEPLSVDEGVVVAGEPEDVPVASSVLRPQALNASTADKATARAAADLRLDAYISVPFKNCRRLDASQGRI
jgi:hypothetical protein